MEQAGNSKINLPQLEQFAIRPQNYCKVEQIAPNMTTSNLADII